MGLSVGSQRNFSNNFIVDGLSANDDAAGLSGIPYGVDAVDQFQVVTSGGQAELGRALGGYVNVVTKSGTNAHARRRLRLLPRRRAERDATRCRARSCRCRRSSTAAASAVRSRGTGRSSSPTSSSACSIRPGLTTITRRRTSRSSTRGWPRSAIPGRRSRPASIRIRCTASNLLGKVDHQFSGSDQLSVRYSLYDVESENSRGAGGLNAPIGVGRARQPRSGDRDQQHADAVAADRQRNARAVRATAICRRCRPIRSARR